MRFEERELNPYAEPISASELTEGAIYFSVTFVDDDMTIPKMETIVYIGKNLDRGNEDSLYFQDMESYREGIRYNAASSDNYATFFTCNTNEIKAIFEFERALEELMRCSLRRKGQTRGQPRA